MCRTRLEIINDEPDIQKLIDLKIKVEAGDINGFTADRKYFELTKLEGQIESTIREFMLMDTQADSEAGIKKLSEESTDRWEKHYELHRKNPSFISLFKKSPTSMFSFGGASLVASSLFYVKETRDVMLNLVGLTPAVGVAGQDIITYAFPLFLLLLFTGIIALTNAKEDIVKE